MEEAVRRVSEFLVVLFLSFAASPALAQSASADQRTWAAGAVSYIQLMRAMNHKIEYATAMIQAASPEIGNNATWTYALLAAGNYPPENIGDYFRQLGVYPQTFDEGPRTHIQIMRAAGLNANDVYQGFSGTWCTPGRAYANNCQDKFNQLNTGNVGVQDLIAVYTYRGAPGHFPLDVRAPEGTTDPATVCNLSTTRSIPVCHPYVAPSGGACSPIPCFRSRVGLWARPNLTSSFRIVAEYDFGLKGHLGVCSLTHHKIYDHGKWYSNWYDPRLAVALAGVCTAVVP
ncbi:hypothetical protein FQ775_04770 [Nitratireductor mangrovi]|uniref:Uncharacterized protein n=1 Tax=Nitratireductor mangrovi TaxID=2599600 RepID=A0A5B8KVN8_9HYPH|nr:hypothetical protein [Nitratireductor mangrovi]QDY99743.1 hypothetical protein FQ775_04770 [Nitratireductor mangrovi]